MKSIVNIDGTLFDAKDAKISVFDRGFLYGDSIYETMRTYQSKIFLLNRHLKRLENSASMLRLNLPISSEKFEQQLNWTVSVAGNKEWYIRLIVTRGKGKIGLDIHLSRQSTYVVVVNPLEPFPSDYYENGVRLAIVSTRRNDRSSLDPRMKTSNLLNNILGYAEAKDDGAFEGILCNHTGYITEGTGSNVFAVSIGVLLTPPLDAGLLEGVTRNLVLELAAHEGITHAEQNITPAEFLESDECFITSTTKGIMPVNKINNTPLAASPGPLTRRLMQAYDRFVEQSLFL